MGPSYPDFLPRHVWESRTSVTGAPPDETNALRLLQSVAALQQTQNPRDMYAGRPNAAPVYQPPALADTDMGSLFGRLTSKGALQEAFNHMQNLREQEAEVLMERARRAQKGR